ncbi:polymorphic toxin-type HINT domain-containing protein, partial [Streptomyces sp. NPDC102462]|uniref:polymorphic toxin-type HINT domain-containing protein n=1 Tax=Streptomyces sp. NPDC102462 TaxID=3366178 RepID=UPI0037F27B03
LSVDPILDTTDPQSLNGYTYADNNPTTHSDPTGLWLDDGTGHSEPHPKNRSGTHRSNVGVPTGGTGRGGCYYTCPDALNAASIYAYHATVAAAEKGAPYVRTAQTVDRGDFHKAMMKYQGSLDGALNDSQWMMWLYGWSEEVIDNFGPCLIFDCTKPITSDDINDLPLNRPGWAETIGRAFADGKAHGEALTAARAGKGIIGSCNHSFVLGTEVLLDNGRTKDIEDVKVGDKVTATDPVSGKTTTRTVIDTIVTKDDKDFVDLMVSSPGHSGTDESVIATTTHPFWSPSEAAWVEAGHLRAGMTLRTASGQIAKVSAARHFTKRQITHDLTIEGVHTYYVLAGQTPVLVHNSNCPNGKLSDPLPRGMNNKIASAYDDVKAGRIPSHDTYGGREHPWWAGSKEYRVPGRPETDRILEKELPNGVKVYGWTSTHYTKIQRFSASHFPDSGWN